MTIDPRKAKALCTASEWQLVEASKRTALAEISAARLKQKVDRARKLRDKWRDQATTQRRTKQQAQNARQTDAAARSHEKAQLFGEVLARFEAALARAVKKDAAAAARDAKAKKPRGARAVENRAARATVRADLKAKKLALNEQSQAREGAAEAAPAAPAKKKGAPKKKAKAKSAAAARTAKLMRQAVASQSVAVPADPTNVLSERRNRQAATAAKARRIARSGQTRIQGHVSSQNKRAQGRRDSRG